MQLALVLGTVTSTVKHPSLEGWKLLVAQPLAADEKSPDGDPVLAIDPLGAGRGETVVITNDGIAARQLIGDAKTPARWSVIGIRDE